MGGAEANIVDAPKELTDTGSDAMLVEEIENSSTIKQSNEVIVVFLRMFPFQKV